MISVDKRKLIFVITGAVLIFAVALLIFDSVLLNKVRQTSQQPESYESTSDNISQENSGLITDEPSDAMDETGDEKESLLYTEHINVRYNSPEYDLELLLCESRDKSNFLRLRYYRDGASTEEELRDDVITELSKESFKISQVLLNPVYSKLYLLIQDGPAQRESNKSLYMINLDDLSVKLLFSYPADFSELLFNNNFKLMAYSFEKPPYISSIQENSLLDVYDCQKDEYIIKTSRDKNNNIIGETGSQNFLYDYELKGWESGTVLRLTQAELSKSDPDLKPVKSEVLYDIEKNSFKVLGDGSTGSGSGDGSSENDENPSSEENPEENPAAGENPDNKPKDSDPAAVLKEFYRCLGSPEEYSRGMVILHSDFKLKIGMLKQFGVEEITKGDIDISSENASLYSELLKGAKFDIIAGEVQNGDVYVITYYHTLNFGAQSDVRQLMSAHLVKHDKHWKIILIEDGIL